MEDFSNPPGSRAIKIPLHSNEAYNTPIRHRHDGRYHKPLTRAENIDAGPSSSVSSDHDSGSWSSSSFSRTPATTSSHHRSQQPIASPPTRDPRLPLSSPPAREKIRKDKHKAISPGSPPSALSHFPQNSPLGPSMLSSSSYKSIDLSSGHDDPDEPPRLITYTKHSQGFTWNDELFLPSYLLGRYGLGSRGRRKEYDADFGDEEMCPVAEIFVTDEEAAAMMP